MAGCTNQLYKRAVLSYDCSTRLKMRYTTQLKIKKHACMWNIRSLLP